MNEVVHHKSYKIDVGNTQVNAYKHRLENLMFSQRMEIFITTLIIVNAVVLGILTYQFSDAAGKSLIHFLVKLDIFIATIFVLEMALKIFASGKKFFTSGWNCFDFIVIAVSIFGSAHPLTIVRSLRVLRTLRLVKRVPSMRIVIESFIRALPGIGSVLTVLVLMTFIFSVIGTQLYGTLAPDLFGTLHASAFTLFTILTLEGWPDVARQVMIHSPGAWVFFMGYIAINSFVILNLIIAVTVDAMHKEYDCEAEEEREDIYKEVLALRKDVKRLLAAKR